MDGNTGASTEEHNGNDTETQPVDMPKPSPLTPLSSYDFRRVVPPTTTRPNGWTRLSASYIIKDAFRLHTLLAIGAGVQMALSAAVPKPWCFLPTAAILALSSAITLVQMSIPFFWYRRRRLVHSYLAGAVPGRSTAHLSTKGPWLLGQTTSEGESKGGLVVFHFGARFNHPLGVLAPGARKMTQLFRATLTALDKDRNVYSLLGGDLFRGGASGRASNDTILLVLYFRNVEGLQRFTGSKVHQDASQWLRAVTTTTTTTTTKTGSGGEQRHPYLSAFHETFVVPAGGYETLYINTAPILLGNTFTESIDPKSEEEGGGSEQDQNLVWVSSLVDADDARLRTMEARLKHGK